MMLKAVTLSRNGEKSDQNEDACLALPSQGIFAVADGVGGNPGGEQASRFIVDAIFDTCKSGPLSKEHLLAVIKKANSIVHQNASDTENAKGMASTLVLAWIVNEKMLCCSVGDSRIYRFRDGDELKQLTEDHVKAVKKGNGTKNMVTRAMGIKADVIPDILEWDWQQGDLLLLMSDGISDQLNDETIAKIVGHEGLSMTDKAKVLVDESEKQGGRDDKTVVMVF